MSRSQPLGIVRTNGIERSIHGIDSYSDTFGVGYTVHYLRLLGLPYLTIHLARRGDLPILPRAYDDPWEFHAELKALLNRREFDTSDAAFNDLEEQALHQGCIACPACCDHGCIACR